MNNTSIVKVKRHLSDRLLCHSVVVCLQHEQPFTVVDVNELEGGLEPTEMEVNIQESSGVRTGQPSTQAFPSCSLDLAQNFMTSPKGCHTNQFSNPCALFALACERMKTPRD